MQIMAEKIKKRYISQVCDIFGRGDRRFEWLKTKKERPTAKAGGVRQMLRRSAADIAPVRMRMKRKITQETDSITGGNTDDDNG